MMRTVNQDYHLVSLDDSDVGILIPADLPRDGDDQLQPHEPVGVPDEHRAESYHPALLRV